DDLAQRRRGRLNQRGEFILVDALPGVAGHQFAQIVAPDFFSFHRAMIALFSKKVNNDFAKKYLRMI
ncbi:hypothetical protein KFY51_27610, partial [Salmonella enterica subsp. enterica serovar 1,4,[5],12:i:-]|nr:hypothetical protein [Salmonella enterica subsp. enterica serovar 1,4,[5],12:i:-]